MPQHKLDCKINETSSLHVANKLSQMSCDHLLLTVLFVFTQVPLVVAATH